MRGVTPVPTAEHTYTAISIHTPHAGSDLLLHQTACHSILFQSTLPMRGVTWKYRSNADRIWTFQSTLPMRGVTITAHRPAIVRHRFQSTLPMRGVTKRNTIQIRTQKIFQSTLPMRGVTGKYKAWLTLFGFQSTLPMRGVTAHPIPLHPPLTDFNPHSPCGE